MELLIAVIGAGLFGLLITKGLGFIADKHNEQVKRKGDGEHHTHA